uniref:Coatomer subunit delta n=1 Tax=Rhizochromulina marina TaxID=1034831 RepID=A0A7S2RJQ4_9STRA
MASARSVLRQPRGPSTSAMVVLSASVCTKNGKALVARQFVGMSRIRIEGLLAAFPKLVGSEAKNTQHTFIETDSVRYVYQPIENLFLLIITNKASNIVEDLETLRLLSKLVPETCGGLTEDKITDKMFDLIFAFDEVITTGGHRESITLQQIQVNVSMESHEEKLHKMIEQSKVSSAKEEADRKAKALQEQRRQDKLSGATSMSGIEGGSTGEDTFAERHMSSGGFSSAPPGSAMYADHAPLPSSASYGGVSSPTSRRDEPVLPKKGMQLGGGSKKQQLMDKLVTEDNLTPLPSAASTAASAAGSAAATVATPAVEVTHPINILLEEKITGALNREGAVESLETKGTMFLTSNTAEACRCQVIMTPAKNPLFAYQTNPKVDKKAYEQEHRIALKDASKGFPQGKGVGVLRWSAATQDDEHVPISINCWPEEDGADMNVNVEYSVDRPGLELHNVSIVIPLGTSASPNVLSVDSGTHRHNRSSEELVWEIELIDESNKSASLEFSVPQRSSDAFFPIQVRFASNQLSAGVDVANITDLEGKPIHFSLQKSAVAESYKVE